MPQRAKSGGTISAMRLGISKGEVGQPGKGNQQILMAGILETGELQRKSMAIFPLLRNVRFFSVLRFSSKLKRSEGVCFDLKIEGIKVVGGVRLRVFWQSPIKFN